MADREDGGRSAATVVVASAAIVATAAAEYDDEENDNPAAVAVTESVTHVFVPPFVSSKPFYVLTADCVIVNNL